MPAVTISSSLSIIINIGITFLPFLIAMFRGSYNKGRIGLFCLLLFLFVVVGRFVSFTGVTHLYGFAGVISYDVFMILLDVISYGFLGVWLIGWIYLMYNAIKN